jgi:hypothetical protein
MTNEAERIVTVRMTFPLLRRSGLAEGRDKDSSDWTCLDC